MLGPQLEVAAIRFDPPSFELEADNLALHNAGGQRMLGFRQLQLDFEWRGLLDRLIVEPPMGEADLVRLLQGRAEAV